MPDKLVLYRIKSPDDLWKIFAESKGCKKDKEDCSFKRCHSWAECENLIDNLTANLERVEIDVEGIKKVLNMFQSEDLLTHSGTSKLAQAILDYLESKK